MGSKVRGTRMRARRALSPRTSPNSGVRVDGRRNTTRRQPGNGWQCARGGCAGAVGSVCQGGLSIGGLQRHCAAAGGPGRAALYSTHPHGRPVARRPRSRPQGPAPTSSSRKHCCSRRQRRPSGGPQRPLQSVPAGSAAGSGGHVHRRRLAVPPAAPARRRRANNCHPSPRHQKTRQQPTTTTDPPALLSAAKAGFPTYARTPSVGGPTCCSSPPPPPPQPARTQPSLSAGQVSQLAERSFKSFPPIRTCKVGGGRGCLCVPVAEVFVSTDRRADPPPTTPSCGRDIRQQRSIPNCCCKWAARW